MARKKSRFTADVSEALTKQVTEEDIRSKYGWSAKLGLNKPSFSVYEKFLVTMSALGLLLVAVLNGFGLGLDISRILSSLAWPITVSYVGLGILVLVVTEAIYEFIAVRGQYKKPGLLEVYAYKFVALIYAVAAFFLASIAAVLAAFGVIVYMNYARTCVQRERNFQVYLAQKKQEIAQNEQLPPKERSEIVYCNPSPSGVIQSPDEDITEEV